jgi:TonB family protein
MGIWIRRVAGRAGGAASGLDANRQWKEGWSTWMARSIAIAVAAHVLIFALWPVWSIRQIPPVERTEIVQLDWIPFYGADLVAEGVPMAALPSVDELELLREEAGTPSPSEADEAAEALAERLTSLTFPEPRAVAAAPTTDPSAGGTGALPVDALILEELLVARPEVVALVSTSPWPLLRNPTVVSRWIASRQHPPDRESAESRAINVLVGIDARGTVEWVEIIDSTGLQSLDDLAISLFRNVAVFAPAQQAGRSIPITLLISMRL